MTLPYKSKFRITSAYGYRTDPITGKADSWHGGLDLVGEDKSVISVCCGTVVRSRMVTDESDKTSEWGNYIAIQSDSGEIVYYCHLSERFAEVGERVVVGQVIGTEGSTGKATGSHLHFEVRRGGVQANAAEYLGTPNEVGYECSAGDGGSSWSDEAVAWAARSGILLGDGSGDLMLNSPCTREEAVVFLFRLHNLISEETKGGNL